ncbi:MAG TPA: aminotransferase class IV [Thermoleophilaceae bacterium]|nr:aminotransferase class IV [Thermoleophilaceae bacterium]
MSELACLDGLIAPAEQTVIPVVDEGLLRGDGAFEVVRVYDGRPLLLDAHLDRMEKSVANLRLEDAFHRERYAAEAAELLAARGGRSFDGCLRLVLTRGGRRLLITEPLPSQPEVVRLASVVYAPTRVLDGVKSLSYAANMLCSRIARERGFDEALMVTPHGRVLEAPTSSLLWVDADGALCTPPLDDHVLASITRSKLIELLDVQERSVALDELRASAVEAMLASTTREVQPVGAIDDFELPAAPGELTRAAAAAFAQHRDELLAAAA